MRTPHARAAASVLPGPGSCDVAGVEIPRIGDVGRIGAGEHGRRLDARAGGDLLG